MSKKILVEQLRTLASDDAKRSKAARLRDVIDEVEATLAAGITRAEVVKKLSENGLEMALATFNSELQKIRKKRGKPSVNPVKSNSRLVTKTIQPVNKPPEVELDDDEEPPLVVSHDPKDIDAIMRSTPDLEYYAKIAREHRKKEKEKEKLKRKMEQNG